MASVQMKASDDKKCVIIQFDEGEDITLSKSLLIENSSYFEAMFSGNFLESKSQDKIHLQGISRKGLLRVIGSLKSEHINMHNVNKVLLLLETSQILQFTEITLKTVEIIEKKWLFTDKVLSIFLIVSKLGLQDTYKKAFINILYYFNNILISKRNCFLTLTEIDLKLLLSHDGLNVHIETDVYDLVIDWCLKNENYDEFDTAVECVRFSCMNKTQLEYCTSKTNNLKLQNTIKQYMVKSEYSSVLVQPSRKVPYVLCTMKRGENGDTFVYQWDWNLLKFVEFFKVDPLPQGTTGYHVAVKDFNLYVIFGEMDLENTCNTSGWKYNFIFKQWKQLKNFIPSIRNHGFAHFCGNELYLIGGFIKKRQPNQLMERFKINKDSLVQDSSYSCNFTKRMVNKVRSCLEYKGQLAVITKERPPVWYQLSSKSSYEGVQLAIVGIVISATVYRDNVYIFAYGNKTLTTTLYTFCPDNLFCTTLKVFDSLYDPDFTICTFNINTALVFCNDLFEWFCLDDNIYQQHSIEFDPLLYKYFFSIPKYE